MFVILLDEKRTFLSLARCHFPNSDMTLIEWRQKNERQERQVYKTRRSKQQIGTREEREKGFPRSRRTKVEPLQKKAHNRKGEAF